MKRVAAVLAVSAVIAGTYALVRPGPNPQAVARDGRQIVCYVDPMHPSYTSDKPGIAPDCGMELVPVYADSAGNAAPTSLTPGPPAGSVRIDGATQRLWGIRVAPVETGGFTREVRVVGRVVPEDSRVYSVNSGVDGFIRETYDDSVGTRVKKDQKLAEYYSPDFLAVASGFLAASQNVPGSVGTDGSRTVPFPGTLSRQGLSSLQGYADRLRNLGMSDVQIKRLADSRQLPESLDVVAPAEGFILARNISPGQHFEHHMEFYRIADLSRVWVIAEVSEAEVLHLHPGAAVQIALREEGRQLAARITDSLPQSEPGGGTVKLRLEAENPGFILRPERLVDVSLPIRLPPAVTVPLDALIDSGVHSRVYVERGEGVFEPRQVETGWRSDERAEILHGLQPGDRVVVEATFLVDSESRLKSPASAFEPAHSMAPAPDAQKQTAAMTESKP